MGIRKSKRIFNLSFSIELNLKILLFLVSKLIKEVVKNETNIDQRRYTIEDTLWSTHRRHWLLQLTNLEIEIGSFMELIPLGVWIVRLILLKVNAMFLFAIFFFFFLLNLHNSNEFFSFLQIITKTNIFFFLLHIKFVTNAMIENATIFL